MPLSFYILCGDATYNRGDRGNLHAQIALLRETLPDSRIIVDSYRPQVDRHWYDARVIARGKFLTYGQINSMKRSDVVVWGGGALLTDNASRLKIPYWAAIIGFVKGVLRKPVMAWAHGLVINTGLGARVGRWVLNRVDLITVRDENSYQTLKRIRATRPPHFLTADPAVLARASSPERGMRILKEESIDPCGRALFAIANTFCPFHYSEKDIIPYMIARPLGLRRTRGRERIEQVKSGLGRIADLMVERYDCDILFLPTYPAPWEEDIRHFQDIVARSTHRDRIHCLKRDHYSPADYLSLWHHFRFVLSVPMHHSIFSTAMEVPCVNLFYEPKGRDFFRSIFAEDRLLPVDILLEERGPERVMERVDHALAHWPDLRERSRAPFEALKAGARQNAVLLKELASSTVKGDASR